MINDDDLDQETYSIPPQNQAQSARRPIIKQASNSPGEAEQTPCQKFDVVTQYTMPEGEKIVYAGYLYDQNPTFILIITVNDEENCSYLSLGKIDSSSNSVKTDDSEQFLKDKLARKLEDNPNVHKVLKRNDGQMNMTLDLTPSTIKMLDEDDSGEKTTQPPVTFFADQDAVSPKKSTLVL